MTPRSIEIPVDISDERFAAIVAWLRVVVGMPTDIVPKTKMALRIELCDVHADRRWTNPFHEWLRDNGYATVAMTREKPHRVVGYHIYHQTDYAEQLLDDIHFDGGEGC